VNVSFQILRLVHPEVCQTMSAHQAGSTATSPSVVDQEQSALPFVQLFTDGACSGNPGPGGWGYILRHPASGKEKEASGGLAETTNNQMELQAVIEGLKALKSRSRVEVVTDSSYVAKGSSEWLPGWKRNGWQRKEGKSFKPVKNVEYWQALDQLLARHQVQFKLIKGHAGHAENERCDVLAVAAAAAAKASANG
jgi:ribonuclease HI